MPVHLPNLPGATAILHPVPRFLPRECHGRQREHMVGTSPNCGGWEKEDDTAVCTVVRSVFLTVHQEGGRVPPGRSETNKRGLQRERSH